MNAFISYSHKDTEMLDLLHKHLAQLHRDGIISMWTDRDILAGSKLDQNISSALNNSKLFMALLSPDYIASNYCDDEEFKKALAMQEEGEIIIIPIIAEPCDWQSTPFKQFKALPKDGKAISTWENKNTSFLDVIQNIRKLIDSADVESTPMAHQASNVPMSRNYRVQKDFDSIEKLEFVEKTFHEIKELLKRFIDEILQLENIKTRILVESNKNFECLLINRNKIATESRLKLSIVAENTIFHHRSGTEQITYSISSNNRPSDKSFALSFDEYHMYWSENSFYSGTHDRKEIGSKEIADIIWKQWLESVGIL